MPCTSPLHGWQPPNGGPCSFAAGPPKPGHKRIQVPCNQCGDCRIRRIHDWGLRCVHEAALHEENSFLTLTYDDANLPEHGSLYKPHLQQFFKRLRHHFPLRQIRYYACGEYGERTQRAHYHVCLFNADFQDKIAFRKIGEHQLYLSANLTKIWGHGNTSIGSLTYQTACYTAAYVMKRVLGKGAQRYVRIDEETGELIPLIQPFAVMSNGGGRRAAGAPRGAGIGATWFHKYHQDIYGHDKDYIYVNGKPFKPARYYDKLYETVNAAHLKALKEIRIEKGKEQDYNLHARAEITRARKTFKNQI